MSDPATPTDMDSTDVDPTDMDPTDMDSTDVDLTDIEPTDIDPTDIDPTDVEAIEAADESAAPAGPGPKVVLAEMDPLDPLEDLIGRLERAAEQLRSGELSTDAAATLVDECAALANRAGVELERRARAEPGGAGLNPGQDSLL
jgi:hypothetical protein